MKKTLLPLILALAPLAVSAHGVHGEPTVYHTPQAAYYVADPAPVEHVLVQPATACGCCGCPVAATPVLPPRPVIVRSVMPVTTTCGPAYYQTSATYVAPAPVACAPAYAGTCQQGYEVQHVDPDPGW